MYWLTATSDQGRNAQYLSGKYTKGLLPENTYFKHGSDGEWHARKELCCFFEVVYDSGAIQKSYK
jgi:hypothetical protein